MKKIGTEIKNLEKCLKGPKMKVCISKGIGNIFDFFYFENTDIFIFHNVLMI
jgi:hypothetical protein